MNQRKYILGLDTSNYKTSVAVTDDRDNIICDFREFLTVKQGEKGLRQSDALFQHIKALPAMLEKVRREFAGAFAAVAYSSKPRPNENSYMPVFLAGESFGKSIAAALGIPSLAFSHQEGHIEAVKRFSALKNSNEFLACHFSGGTCELLKVSGGSRRNKAAAYDTELVGGSKDISFGQVIDRAGVMLGYAFPAGEYLDRLAVSAEKSTDFLTPVKVSDAQLNLSGIDTQIKNIIEKTDRRHSLNIADCDEKSYFAQEIFKKISDAMARMICQGAKKTGLGDILMAGGVSSSEFIRKDLEERLRRAGINAVFDELGLSQDNAVGTALLGGKQLWD